MPLGVVRAVVPLREPRWFRVGHLGYGVRRGRRCELFFALDCSYLQPCVLGSEEDLVAVQAEECLGRVFPGCGKQSLTLVDEVQGRWMGHSAPIESAKSTAAPPGCRLAKRETSYTFESMIIH